jgi:hypothetical protein
MQLPSKESFQAAVGSEFALPFDNGSILVLTLEKLVERCDLDAEGLVNYSLFFKGPLNFPLRQGTFSMGHEQLGQVYLFLVPISQDIENLYYQAVISARPSVAPAPN